MDNQAEAKARVDYLEKKISKNAPNLKMLHSHKLKSPEVNRMGFQWWKM